jgi:hypothetical protein
MSVTAYVPNAVRNLAEACVTDFGRLAYDGFGVMLSDEQLEARWRLGRPGPRRHDERKVNFLSGGQRGGKTVDLALFHAESCLYKIGVDNTSRAFWNNYLFKTLAGAPTNDLSLKLWTVFDEMSKGASDAQFDRRSRVARGGAFLHLFKAGKINVGQASWPVVRFSNGARVDFRSTEGYAYRLEGDQWWFVSWDEWASQPDREIEFVLTDVLMGRSRDHDAKIVPAAWPKAATERHLIGYIRKIEKGEDRDSQVIYLSAEKAYFTNRRALAVEKRRKSESSWKRTVLGEPAGGASLEFTQDMIENMVRDDLTYPASRETGYLYFSSWDLGLAHDSTVGLSFRIPIIEGRGVVDPAHKARICNAQELHGGEHLTLDMVAASISAEQLAYRSQTAVDATGLGGTAAFRQLAELDPPPLAFKSRSNDRIYGNMRLAAITNGLDLLTWGKPPDDGTGDPGTAQWGLVEAPRIAELVDQLANFDRDAKDVPDDWVWSLLIGLWYIRRYWVVGSPDAYRVRDFDIRRVEPSPLRRRNGTVNIPPASSTGVAVIVPPGPGGPVVFHPLYGWIRSSR